MSEPFKAGAIGFALQLLGAEVFQQDAKAADKALTELGTSAETAAKKVSPLGTEVDKTGTAAKNAKAPLDDAGKSTKTVGDESEKASKKVAPLATDIDKTGKASKDAKAPVDEAGKSTKKLGDENTTAAPKVKQTAAELEALKVKSDQAGRTVGTVALGIGTAFAAMATVAVAKFADFDQAVSQVGAATMASGDDLDALSASAVQAGVDTVFTATKAANAQTELAKAGVSVTDILGGALTGSLALASAGELEVARAAEIAATTLGVFNLKGSDAGHVADLLAAGAGKAQGSVEDLALGLDYVGVTFSRLGIPLEDTVGSLALLASNGLLGEKAGTGLRSVISSLTAPVAKGAAEMEKYGINVFDASGKFIGMAGTAEELKTGLGGLDEQTRSAALGAIFGAEAASAAGILYAAGAEGVEKWTANVNDSGFAAEQARMKLDNLAGDIEMLGGSMDAALIKTGSTANDTLREMVQIVTGLVDWYSGLSKGVQGIVLVVGVGIAAVALLSGTMLLAVPKIAAYKFALEGLNTTMRKTAFAGGAVGLAITAAVVILGAFGAAQAASAAKSRDYGDTLLDVSNKISGATREMVKANLAAEISIAGFGTGSSAYDAAEKLGIGLDLVTDAASGIVPAMNELLPLLNTDTSSESFKNLMKDTGLNAIELTRAINDVKNGVKGESASIEDAIRVAEQKQRVDDETVDSNGEVVASEEKVADSIDGVVTSIADLLAEMDALNGKNLDARDAARNLEGAYDDFDAALKENGPSLNQWATDLDLTTQAGRDNQDSLDAIAAAAGAAGQAILDSGGSYQDYQASLVASKAEIDKRIADLGITGQAAQDLSDKILSIPTDAEFTMAVETAAATAKLNAFLALYNSTPEQFRAGPGILAGGNSKWGAIAEADGAVVSYYANGGTSEIHTAQIERAGAMRVWAEPETGGEAYIPMSPAKRGRSTAILETVAEQFGYQLVPYGAQAFANGSAPAARSTSARAAWTGDINVTTAPNEDPRILAKQIGREFATQMAGWRP